MTILEEQEAIADYKSGMTIRQVARKYHVADNVISCLIKGLPTQK